MIRRLVLAAFTTLAFALALGAASPALAQDSLVPPAANPNQPSSGELVEDPKTWDGKTITFTGEAITQAMVRGDHAWIHLNDDAYYAKNVEEGAELGGYNSGHAVWLPASLAEKISHFGDYTHEGDVVRVTGTFNAACGEHGGDMDIHADSLEVVVVGHEFHEPVDSVKAVIAALLVVLAGALWLVNRRTQRRDMFGPLRGRRRGSRAA